MQASRKATRKSAGGALSEREVQWKYDEIRLPSFRIPHADTLAAILRYFKQGEVEVASKKVSLLCPISKARIKDPARGVDCKHLECFDLRSYLEFHTRMAFWECPFEFCKAAVHVDDLRIDEYFSSIITTTRQTVAAVELLSDGSYRSLKTPVVASVVIKEDEEEVSETEATSNHVHIKDEADEKRGPTSSQATAKKRKKKTRDQPLKCTTCGNTYSSARALYVHKMIHRGVKKYECNVCGLRFTQSGTFKTHYRIHSGERPYACHLCERKFATCGQLSCHVRTHTGEKPFKCSVCEKAFKRQDTLKNHMRTHSEDKPFQCTTCGKKFMVERSLVLHTQAHVEKSFKCAQCPRSYTRKEALEKHVKTRHDGQLRSACPFCAKGFEQFSDMMAHKRTVHADVKQLVCAICGLGFARQRSLIEHIRTHTGDKPHKCLHCDYRSATLSCLRNHEKTHTDERPYSCSRCSSRFRLKSHLDRHFYTHTTNRPFACNLCSRTFIRRDALQTHQKAHGGERPYECGTCGKRCSEPTQLREHEVMHTGKMPLACVLCDKPFSSRKTLKRHVRTVHEAGGPHRCGNCGQGYARKDSLQLHAAKCQGTNESDRGSDVEAEATVVDASQCE